MEVEFSFVGLDRVNWFPRLEETLRMMESNPDFVIDQVLPPPGSLGAGAVAMLKASFASTVGLATIVGGGASLYGVLDPRPAACEVSVQTDQVKTTMTYECRYGTPADVAAAVSKLVAESLANHIDQHGLPQKVTIRPIRPAH
jgi:hypothetical protein